ncbi:MAG TPA: ParB/RepB/Spo0J family partition protein [Candidatus Binatia bacterium]|nr:ParB/RepB/Spo0J family partition protein [Candidatus Binatia bacterium]
MRKALGRGLEALLPGAPPASSPSRPEPAPVTVPLREIVANPEQPRRHFEPQALAALAESIRLHGLLQPIVVRRAASGYEIIAGERRFRAASQLGLDEVPVVLRDADPQTRLELALIENIQREDLSPLEEAEAYRHLIDEYGLTQEEIARQVGKSRPAVANALRLLSLPEAVKVQLESGELSAGHARAVLSVEGVAEQVEFARDISARKLPKSEAERLAAARRTKPTRRSGAATMASDPHWHGVSEELTRALGTRVRITPRAKGGSIEIEFYSDGELDRLIDRLRAPARS